MQAWMAAKDKDPMEGVAKKIRRGETLSFPDLKYWVSYNFFAFEESD
jgi:hypothetical protein